MRLLSRFVEDELGRSPDPWELFAIKHHSFGSIGCTIEWLKGDLQATPEQLAAWEFERMPDFLQEAFRA